MIWDGWAWCLVLVNVLAVVVFLGVVIAAVALAVRARDERRGGPSALPDGDFAGTRWAAAPGARGGAAHDDYYRRLM